VNVTAEYSLNWRDLERKWQRKWSEAKVFESDPETGRKKYFITVAYPYPNSPQHVGHGRTYTLADVHARYMRMRGYNVLFPMAFHYTGTPILAMSKRLAAGDKDLIEVFKGIYKVPDAELKEFTEPIKIARYFHEEIKAGMKEMGYSIDWRREFTTIDPPYSKFIEWQFEKLREKGYITRGTHPVGWCPSCGNPVGQHDTKDDVEPEVGEFVIIKFRIDNRVLPAATLRPETVFGVTNLWLKPNSEYVVVEVDGEEWIVSEECSKKLSLQGRKVNVKARVLSRELFGKHALNPVTNTLIPILPGDFVDLKNATGVVMSVPAHAPYDYVALEELKARVEGLKDEYKLNVEEVKALKPIPIISVPGYSLIPAADVVNRMGIKGQEDVKLEDATREVYRREFHEGVMRDNTGKIAGLPVSKAKKVVVDMLLSMGVGSSMFELLNRPVYCRCGAECVVKIFEDQWFINYGDEEWKRLAGKCVDQMSIIPEELREELRYVISWLKERACARRFGLGTKLPWDPEWIIESLSDSVIYMAYYTIAKVINEYGIRGDQLTNSLFDYVFLGVGDPSAVSRETGLSVDVINEMRNQFTYYYPLDSRHSGRDLLWNHLAFMIFNHVAIFNQDLWPKEIVMNGSVLMEGKKMSKSLGNIIPLRDAIRSFGADALRLSLLMSAELLQDVDFSGNLAKSMDELLKRFYGFALRVLELKKAANAEAESTLADRWMLSRLQRHIKAATEAMDKVRVREAAHVVLKDIDRDVQWYLKLVAHEMGSEKRKAAIASVLMEVLDAQTRMASPFVPHLCEEIWEMMGRGGFVSTAEWPKYDEGKLDYEAEEVMDYVASLIEDTIGILKATNIRQSKIFYYVAAPWKVDTYLEMLRSVSGRTHPSLMVKEYVGRLKGRVEGRDVASFVQRATKELTETHPNIRERRKVIGALDEKQVISMVKPFLVQELKAEVYVYREDEEKYDPKGKAKLALPYRPAIYIE